jgi:hypothetical protein
MSGFRQQLHVQTLQEKLQSDNEQLGAAIRVLRQQVGTTVRVGIDDQFQAGDEEDSAHWQRSMVLICGHLFVSFVTNFQESNA